MKNYIIFISGYLLTSCALVDYDVTDNVINSQLINKCYELTNKTYITEYYGLGNGYDIQAAGVNECYPDNIQNINKRYSLFSGRKCPENIIGTLDPGTTITITKAIDKAFGSAGRCWSLKAKITNGVYIGKTVNLPTCSFTHNNKINWLSNSRRPFALSNKTKPLSLKQRFAKTCSN